MAHTERTDYPQESRDGGFRADAVGSQPAITEVIPSGGNQTYVDHRQPEVVPSQPFTQPKLGESTAVATDTDVAAPVVDSAPEFAEVKSPTESAEIEHPPLDPRQKRITTVRMSHGVADIPHLPKFGEIVRERVAHVRTLDPNARVGVHIENVRGDPGFASRVRELVRDPDNPRLPSAAMVEAIREARYPELPDDEVELTDLMIKAIVIDRFGLRMAEELDKVVEAESNSIDLIFEWETDETRQANEYGAQAGVAIKELKAKGIQNWTDHDHSMANWAINASADRVIWRDFVNAQYTAGLAHETDVHEVVSFDGTLHRRGKPLVEGGYTVEDVNLSEGDTMSPTDMLIERRLNDPTQDVPMSDIRMAFDAIATIRAQHPDLPPREQEKLMADWIAEQNAKEAEEWV